MKDLKLNLKEKDTVFLNIIITDFLDNNLSEIRSNDCQEAIKLASTILVNGLKFVRNYFINSELMDRILANATNNEKVKPERIDEFVKKVY